MPRTRKAIPKHVCQYDFTDPQTLKCTVLGCRERSMTISTDRRRLLAELHRRGELAPTGKALADFLQDKRRRSLE